jgi:hypothetical protein
LVFGFLNDYQRIGFLAQMGEGVSVNAAAMHTAMNAVQALGRGFDVNYDTRLLYCKGVTGSKVVEIDQEHARDLLLCGGFVVPNVSRDIKNSLVPIGRQSSGVRTFHEVGFFIFFLVLILKFCSFLVL